MTANPAPHQPAPENVSKAAIDHLGLKVFSQMSMEEELESGDKEASAIFRDLYQCVDIAESAERLNAQKDALIAAQNAYIDWLEADGVNDSYHRRRIAQAKSLLDAPTANPENGKDKL